MALLRLKRKYAFDKFYPNVSKTLFPEFAQIAEQGDHYIIYRVSNDHLTGLPSDVLVDVFASSNKKDLSGKRFFGHITFDYEGTRIHAAYCFSTSTGCINSVRKALGLELIPEPQWEQL